MACFAARYWSPPVPVQPLASLAPGNVHPRHPPYPLPHGNVRGVTQERASAWGVGGTVEQGVLSQGTLPGLEELWGCERDRAWRKGCEGTGLGARAERGTGLEQEGLHPMYP